MGNHDTTEASGAGRRRLFRRCRWLMTAWLVVLAAGCGDSVTASVEVRGLTRIEPREGWARIYGEVEECTGVEGDFERVEWFRAAFIGGRTDELSDGAWLVAEGRPHGIALLGRLLREGADHEVDAVVRHEVIHEVLQLGSHLRTVWCRCDDRPELFSHCR